MRKFVAPEIVFGVGARGLAGTYARNLGANRVLLVTDAGVLAAGWAQEVFADLAGHGLAPSVFAGVTPDPKAAEVMAGAEQHRREGCDMIVAVGGSSPLDCAKGIGIVVAHDQNVLDFEGVDQVSVPIPPLVCVPTTGASADVSQFAIITDPARKAKITIASKAIVPDVALVDPETLLTLPREQTTYTGLDALTHGIEAYLSNAGSPTTNLLALDAIRLLASGLPAALANPADLGARKRTMLAGHHAGLAFSNASLGIVHALAHAVGGLTGAPHGACNGALLRHGVAFSFEAVPERMAQVAQAMGFEPSDPDLQQALPEGILRFCEALGAPSRLADLGVRREDIPRLAENAAADVCLATSPRWPSRRDLEDLLEQAL